MIALVAFNVVMMLVSSSAADDTDQASVKISNAVATDPFPIPPPLLRKLLPLLSPKPTFSYSINDDGSYAPPPLSIGPPFSSPFSMILPNSLNREYYLFKVSTLFAFYDSFCLV